MHYLSPEVVQRRWTKLEDQLLESLVEQGGRRWKDLQNFFHGRTYIHIKNRYNLLTRRHRRNERNLVRLTAKMAGAILGKAATPLIQNTTDDAPEKDAIDPPEVDAQPRIWNGNRADQPPEPNFAFF
jgi:hypothetical protein